MNILNLPFISRLRRNHALEHATIHILSAKRHPLSVVGRAALNGYYLYGDLDTEVVKEAAGEALTRLQAGEDHLAIHPNCGTNVVAAGSLAGLATFLVLGSHKKKWSFELLPNALLAATAALILSQPVGPRLQAHVTTLADLEDLMIKDVRREIRRNLVIHFVETG
jgi:hypothetical protein